MKKTLLLLSCALLLSGCGYHPQPDESAPIIEFEAQTWTLSFSGTESDVQGQTAKYFADAVYAATNGAVTVELYPENRLTEGDPAGAFQAVSNGTASLGLYDSLTYEKADTRLGVVSLPFLFSSSEDAFLHLDGEAGAALGEVLRERGQQPLGFGEAGFRYPTNSVRPVAAPEDLRGMKLRVEDSAMLREAYRLWGADCVTADWPMVFTALRTGTYEGQEAFLTTADAASIQSVQGYLTRWSGIYSCLYFTMNRALYDSISPELRSIVDRYGAEAIGYQRELARAQESDILRRWKKVEVLELTEEQSAAFREAAQPCYDRFRRLYPDLTAAFTARVEAEQ